MPQLKLVDPAKMPEDIRQLTETFDQWIGDTVYARVMANNPQVFKKFYEFYGSLLGGNVESESKELARLRLARLNNCHY
jgi:alkylhydroperoxidase family enzyme